MPPLHPLDGARNTFTLDTSGVAGFFGGEEAISALASVHMYTWRKYLGWYNSPGSFIVAKRFGLLANSRFWDGLFPGFNLEPAELFEYDGQQGPEFLAALSGTHIKQTGNVARLFFSASQSDKIEAKNIGWRTTTPSSVTIATLNMTPPEKVEPKLPLTWSSTAAAVPILVSIIASVLCGLAGDWFCFSMIILGILSGGLSTLAIGHGTLQFTHHKPADGSPPGNGILTNHRDVVVVFGTESQVNSITRGKFSIEYDNVLADASKPSAPPERRAIGLAALLLNIQFLAQLLLIPQGTLFGQLMFLATFAVSWAYSCYLSSKDKEELQKRLLLDGVMEQSVTWKKYTLGTWTTMVVFVLLTLCDKHPGKRLDARKILNNLLPNDTPTWTIWKEVVLAKLESVSDESDTKSVRRLSFPPSAYENHAKYGQLGKTDKELLEKLFKDAESAYMGYDQGSRSNSSGVVEEA